LIYLKITKTGEDSLNKLFAHYKLTFKTIGV
jgi:hypothetical protein